ncbi:hypothetical protein Ndes2437A_g05046 [Nannochloris sp. 'desiccata']
MGEIKRSRRRVPVAPGVGRWIIVAFFASMYLLIDIGSVLWPERGRPCLPDDEGSWSIGTFRGPSPLNLTPIESTSPRVDCPAASAWPAANPVLTCASVTDTPSNFVADPFIFAKSGVPKELGPPNQPPLHIFFETKSNIVMRGEIGVAESLNGGATWQYIGIALSEPWHLSYPYVFSWNNQVYMMPEGSGSGSLRLYRAVDYPLRWELEKELINKPLVDASLVEWKGRWYLFASDPSRPGHKKNAELQIFHSEAPLGPWTQHYLNPVMSGDPRSGARMAGRLLKHNDRLYRFGQDCSGTYGRNVAAFRIDVLSPTEFDQTRIKFTSRRTKQGIGAWNGVRRHHIDALQLGDGSWLAVMDGDWQESNPLSKTVCQKSGISMGTWYYLSLVRETPAAPTAIAIDGTFSRFTVVITSFSLRINTLQSVVTHYSRCPSIAQILVVWNGEQVPVEGTITAAVPVNFRVERNPSLNNRFKPDGIANIPTRAVLSLDDDIMLQCADVENAFAEWRRHPEGLVGFHPRLLSANPGGYFDEQETLKAGKYNALFTGAVFMDADKCVASSSAASSLSDSNTSNDPATGLLQDSSAFMPPLRYVRPHRRLDLTTAAGIGSNHKGVGARGSGGKKSQKVIRQECIDEMTQLFGTFPLREVMIEPADGEVKGALCSMFGLGCI